MLPPNLARALAKGTVMSCFIYFLFAANVSNSLSLRTINDILVDTIYFFLQKIAENSQLKAYSLMLNRGCSQKF